MSHRYTAAEMSAHMTAVATKSGMTKGIIVSFPDLSRLQFSITYNIYTFLRTISKQKLKPLEPGAK